MQWVYSARTTDELRRRYDEWASDYDDDLDVQDEGYVSPRRAAEVVAKYVNKTGRVLDAGVGTGLTGEALSALGFDDLAGIDLSPAMLYEARKKGIYGELLQMVLGERLDYFDDTFDAIVCVGTLAPDHAPASALGEFVRVARPGGCVVFTLQPDAYETEGFREWQEALERAGKWRFLHRTEPFQAFPHADPQVMHQVWAYEVLDGRE